MAANYLPYEPQQMMLLPETLQKWLPEGHPAHEMGLVKLGAIAVDGTKIKATASRLQGDDLQPHTQG